MQRGGQFDEVVVQVAGVKIHYRYTDEGHPLLLRLALSKLAGKSTLLIWGDRDRAVGLSSGRQLASMLPQSSLLVIPGAGHIAFEEMPDVCNQAMSDWLTKTPARGRQRCLSLPFEISKY